ncbi:MAG: signal peptide peptidase SppA [Methyloligellaceae bacterium]
MTLQADALVDRRRLKRRLSLWRVLAVGFALALIAALALQLEDVASSIGYGSQVARVSVGGIIRDDRDQQKLLDKIAKADNVKALILRINSPGGTTSGGESLFEAIRGVAEKKPVVAVFGTVATSAAYMAALASDHIVARANSITGSVGVIFQWAEVTKLMKTLGIKIEEIKSGPLKANPSPFQPIDEAGRRISEEMVGEAQKWFLDLVAKRRVLKPDDVPGLRDGRVYSGRKAQQLKLIDAIGGEDTARDWLAKEREIDRDLPVVDWEKGDGGRLGLLGGIANMLARSLGLPPIVIDSVANSLATIRSVQLDGLVSLWHPRLRR